MGLGKNNVRVCFDITKEDWVKLRDKCAKDRLSVAEYIRNKLNCTRLPERKKPPPMFLSDKIRPYIDRCEDDS